VGIITEGRVNQIKKGNHLETLRVTLLQKNDPLLTRREGQRTLAE